MKNKVKKILFAMGILTGFSAAMIPMASYAATSKTATSHVEVTVMPAISLEIVIDDPQDGDDTGDEGGNSGEEVGDGEENLVLFDNPVLGTTNEAGFTAIVSTNQAYTLSINALDGQTDLLPAGMTSENAPVGNKIPGTGNITEGSTSWGVKLGSATEYSAIPANITQFYESADPAQDAETAFTVGLATSVNGILSGTYSSTLVVTAATK